MKRLQIASALVALAVAASAPHTLRAVPQGEGLTILQRSPESGQAVFAAAKGQGIQLPVGEADAAADRALAFVDLYGQAFGLQTRAQVGLARAPQRDELGFEHVRFQQVHLGVPVTGAEFLVHLKGARAMAANGRVLEQLTRDVTPTLPAPAAQAAAREYIAAQKAPLAPGARYTEPRLEVFNRSFLEHKAGGISQLAWFVEATGDSLREYIWIDAHTGAVLLAFSQLHAARNRQVYNANGAAALPGTLARSEGEAATGVQDVDLAYAQSGLSYTYFFNNHARDSYDGAGGTIVSSVNWADGVSCPNAFWNGTQMIFCANTTREDIVGHEFTHGVTGNEANFFSFGLSGSLSESFSDIFGETIDLLTGPDPPGDRWLIGETSTYPVRSMVPSPFYFQPGRVSDPNFQCSTWNDFSVHHNSGVPSHAYALMVDGGTYNGRTVTGIGLAKAAKIQYRALTTYLTRSSDFLDDFNALKQSCSDLIGTLGINSADCAQVESALLAVEMNSPVCVSNLANGTVPAVCPAGGTPTYTFREGFETGAPGWTVSPASPARWVLDTFYVDDGAVSAHGQAPGVMSDHSFASPSIVVPAGGRMMFRHAHDFTVFADGGVLEYTTNGGATWTDTMLLLDGGAGYNAFLNAANPLGARQAFSLMSFGYTPTRLNLSSLAGQTARFRWRIGTSGSVVTNGWFLDKVDVYACPVAPGAPTITSPPVPRLVPLGGTATFTVTAAGNPTLRYQWFRNGFPIPGATSSSLTLTNAQWTDIGQYYSVMVSNDVGTATSDGVRLVLLASGELPPLFVTQPQSKTITAGQTTSLFAEAVYGVTSYQWQLSTNGGTVWNPVPNVPPYSGVTGTTLTITAAPIGLNNTRYRLAATNPAGTQMSQSAVLNVLSANLITNGDFATGDTTGWVYFETPAGTGERRVNGGVFEWNRPGNSSTQSVLFQTTGAAVSGTPLAAQFDLGNSSTIRKRVSVLMIDADFSDITVCTFWLEPAAPMRTYRMRTHTTKSWTNAAIYFYASTTGNAATTGGYLQLDNVSMNHNPTGSDLRTECEDPTSPAPPGGADSANLLMNGDFSGGMTGWATFGVITSQVSNGVFEYIRQPPGPAIPAGVVFQQTGQAAAMNEFFTATFDLGNSSVAKKRITVLILANDFTDLAACTFWLPAGLPLSTYQMKMRATKAWAAGASTGAAIYFYAATVSFDRWIRLDNVVLQRTPGAAIIGTECLEPVEVLKPFSAGEPAQITGPPGIIMPPDFFDVLAPTIRFERKRRRARAPAPARAVTGTGAGSAGPADVRSHDRRALRARRLLRHGQPDLE